MKAIKYVQDWSVWEILFNIINLLCQYQFPITLLYVTAHNLRQITMFTKAQLQNIKVPKPIIQEWMKKFVWHDMLKVICPPKVNISETHKACAFLFIIYLSFFSLLFSCGFCSCSFVSFEVLFSMREKKYGKIFSDDYKYSVVKK